MRVLSQIWESLREQQPVSRLVITKWQSLFSGPLEYHVALFIQVSPSQLLCAWHGFLCEADADELHSSLIGRYGKHRIVTNSVDVQSYLWLWSSESFQLYRGSRRHGRLSRACTKHDVSSQPYEIYELRFATQGDSATVFRAARQSEHRISELDSVAVWISRCSLCAGVSLCLKSGRVKRLAQMWNILPLQATIDPVPPEGDIEDEIFWSYRLGANLAEMLQVPCVVQDPESRYWRTLSPDETNKILDYELRREVSVHRLTESDRRATEVAEKQGWKERRQGPDGNSEGGEVPQR